MPDATATATAPTTAATPPAAAPPASTSAAMTTATGAPPTTQTVNPGSWMAGLNDEARGWASTKGFQDTGALVDSYRNLEKAIGAPKERVALLPEKFYDDAGKLTPEGRQIYERLGAPKEAKDYGLEVPKEGGDPARADNFQKIAHELGLTKTQVQKLAAADTEYFKGLQAADGAAKAQAFKDQDALLAKNWGAAKEQNTRIAQEAYRNLGMTAQEVDGMSAAIGHAKTMELLLKLGKGLGESSFISGTPAADRMMDPASATAQIKALKEDRGFQEKFNAGDKESIDKWTRLHQMKDAGQFISI